MVKLRLTGTRFTLPQTIKNKDKLHEKNMILRTDNRQQRIVKGKMRSALRLASLLLFWQLLGYSARRGNNEGAERHPKLRRQSWGSRGTKAARVGGAGESWAEQEPQAFIKSRLAPDVKSSAVFWTEPACEVNYSRVWKSHLKGLDRTASGAHTELGIVPALTSELGKRDSELRMEHTVLLQ